MCQTHARFEIEKQQHEIVTISLEKRCRVCDDLEIDNDFSLFGRCPKTGKLHAFDHICIL